MKCPACSTDNLQQMKDASGRFICLKCGEIFTLEPIKKKGILDSIFK